MSVRLSIRSSICPSERMFSAAPTERISMKSDIGAWLKSDKDIGHFT
jgi:hypothetical protein